MTDKDEGRWNLDKRVALAVLGFFAAQTVSLIGWGMGIERRQAVTETQMAHAARENDRQDAIYSESMRLLRDDMRAVRDEMRELNRRLADQTANGRALPR